MKKLFALLMALCLLFSLTACEQEDVELALDIAVAVLEEMEEQEKAEELERKRKAEDIYLNNDPDDMDDMLNREEDSYKSPYDS